MNFAAQCLLFGTAETPPQARMSFTAVLAFELKMDADCTMGMAVDLQKFKAVLITVTLIGMGIGLLSFGWSRVRADRLLDQSSIATEGRVLDSRVYKGSRGGEWPTLVVEYSPEAHGTITRDFDVDRSTYQTALETGKVRVSYWPEDPKIGRVTRFETFPFQFLIGLGGTILAAGLFCLLHFIKKGATGSAGNS